MPPINQPQGSRGGLITALVIFAVLFLTATIFAIYFNVNLRQQEQKYAANDQKYKSVISEGSLVAESDVATAVKTAQSDPALSDTSLKWVDVLQQRGDRLAKVIGGGSAISGLTAESDATQHITADSAALAKVPALKGIKIGSDNLVGSLDMLTKALITQTASSDAETKKLTDQLADSARIVNDSKTTIEGLQKAVDAAQADAKKAMDDAAADRTAKQTQVDASADSQKKSVDDLNAAVQAKQVEITAAQAKLTKALSDLDISNKKLSNYRINTTETTVRNADGTIARVAGGNTVYITLGQGDQVVAGMTFEVYDKAEGIPPLGSDGLRDEEMPVGKGSIEIVRVGASTSECRVVKTTPGQTIAEGDLIANLVYDKNVKFSFVVYGKFDLDNNGVATDADTDVVKRLVTQWGGKIVPDVTADTDFVVLGKEPALPVFSKDELDLPENAKKLADAQTELDAYQKVKADARELHIPVMNQNRFLYFVGYYDQANR